MSLKPSQEALRAYLIAKLGEGVFSGLSSPAAVGKKALSEFSVDLPVVLSSLLDMAADSGAKVVGKIVLDRAADVAREVAQRGFANVMSDLAEQLNMQHQRGVERMRKKAR